MTNYLTTPIDMSEPRLSYSFPKARTMVQELRQEAQKLLDSSPNDPSPDILEYAGYTHNANRQLIDERDPRKFERAFEVFRSRVSSLRIHVRDQLNYLPSKSAATQ